MTGTPEITPPPTDTLSTQTTPSNDSWRLVLMGMAGILAGVLLLTPAPARRRNTKR